MRLFIGLSRGSLQNLILTINPFCPMLYFSIHTLQCPTTRARGIKKALEATNACFKSVHWVPCQGDGYNIIVRLNDVDRWTANELLVLLGTLRGAAFDCDSILLRYDKDTHHR